MTAQQMSNETLDCKLALVEGLMRSETNVDSLKTLIRIFQMLLEEQVRRDLDE